MMMSAAAAAEAESTSTSLLLPTTSASAAEEVKAVGKQQQQQTQLIIKEEDERNFIFGYGSLICDQSRSLSNPTLGDSNKAALPVTIHHVQRIWSARTKNGWTAVGVHFENGKNCTGVLIEVTAEELADLDKREASYNRRPICLGHIEQVSFLNQQEFYNDHNPVFDAKESNINEDQNKAADDKQQRVAIVKVWIYTQRDAILADSSHPILQSYVDIILRGCLKISKDFAKSFIETTHGWCGYDDDMHYYFVNDREVPIYPKADPVFSNEHGNKRIIDQLLQEHIPDVMEDRVDYDPLHHLEALSDALEEDKAHPKAIKHVVKQIIKAAAKSKQAREEEQARLLPDDGYPLVT